MSIPEDEQFEEYLKQFRPLDAEPLPMGKARGTQRRFGFAAGAVAAAAILAAAVLTIHPRPKPVQSTHDAQASSDAERPARAPQQARSLRAGVENPVPLTVNSANALLNQSSSIDEVVERFIVQSQPVPIPKGKHSALAVLSQEDPT
jgi:hypothetical protein